MSDITSSIMNRLFRNAKGDDSPKNKGNLKTFIPYIKNLDKVNTELFEQGLIPEEKYKVISDLCSLIQDSNRSVVSGGSVLAEHFRKDIVPNDVDIFAVGHKGLNILNDISNDLLLRTILLTALEPFILDKQQNKIIKKYNLFATSGLRPINPSDQTDGIPYRDFIFHANNITSINTSSEYGFQKLDAILKTGRLNLMDILDINFIFIEADSHKKRYSFVSYPFGLKEMIDKENPNFGFVHLEHIMSSFDFQELKRVYDFEDDVIKDVYDLAETKYKELYEFHNQTINNHINNRHYLDMISFHLDGLKKKSIRMKEKYDDPEKLTIALNPTSNELQVIEEIQNIFLLYKPQLLKEISKSKKISGDIEGITKEKFQEKLKKELYRIFNRADYRDLSHTFYSLTNRIEKYDNKGFIITDPNGTVLVFEFLIHISSLVTFFNPSSKKVKTLSVLTDLTDNEIIYKSLFKWLNNIERHLSEGILKDLEETLESSVKSSNVEKIIPF
jgi:hypothetical protein